MLQQVCGDVTINGGSRRFGSNAWLSVLRSRKCEVLVILLLAILQGDWGEWF